MNRFFEFIEQHKFGIIATLLVYVGFFMIFNLETYKKSYLIPVWDERAELEKPEILIKPENIEISPQEQLGEVKNIARDVNDTRDKSYDNWSEEKASKEAEQRVKEWEKQDFQESGQAQKREKIKEQQKINQTKTEKSNPKTTKTNQSGGDQVFKGSVMVDWSLKDRQAHQNDSWNIRNPGYTCGQGSSGLVYIKIRVDQSGHVIQATYVSQQSNNASNCMIEQALKYAKLSRFNFEAKAPDNQDGFIRYTFISQ